MAQKTNFPSIVKITFNEEIRRMNDITDYDKLVKSVSSYFDLNPNSFKLKYIDDEEDLITISTDEDLEAALDFFNQSPLKIKVYLNDIGMSNFSIISKSDIPYWSNDKDLLHDSYLEHPIEEDFEENSAEPQDADEVINFNIWDKISSNANLLTFESELQQNNKIEFQKTDKKEESTNNFNKGKFGCLYLNFLNSTKFGI